MQTQSRFFDDIAKLGNSAFSTLSGVKEEVEARVRDQMERVLRDMDMVSREEFETVRAMAEKARLENEALEKRIADLEARAGQAGNGGF